MRCVGKDLLASSVCEQCSIFKVYLWTRGTLLSEELLGGKEGLAGSSEPAVDVDEDDSMTTGNEVVRGLE